MSNVRKLLGPKYLDKSRHHAWFYPPPLYQDIVVSCISWHCNALGFVKSYMEGQMGYLVEGLQRLSSPRLPESLMEVPALKSVLPAFFSWHLEVSWQEKSKKIPFKLALVSYFSIGLYWEAANRDHTSVTVKVKFSNFLILLNV